MTHHLPILIIIVPLIAALLITALSWINRRWCFSVACAAFAISLAASAGVMSEVLEKGVVTYHLAGWRPPVGIELRLDHLNALVLLVIFGVALLNLVGSRLKVQADFPNKAGTFYALSVLFVTGLAGITITGDAFNLYVLLEITALTGYALIGMGQQHAPLAGLNYLIMGTIGASFYLLGVGFLYMMTGSLNMAELSTLLPELYGTRVVMFAFFLCLVGLFIKMALFPLHSWLPNAYTYMPTAASGLIASLTTKVMIYVMIRISLLVFTPAFSFGNAMLMNVLVWVAVISIVAGSILALAQKSVTRMLTYIIIAEVGYMVGGFWLGNRDGVTGSVLHLVNDAAMTLCLFLVAGSFRFRLDSDRFSELSGSFRHMPFTMIAFVVGGLSIIGVPPTCGFFSKWYLIKGGLAAGSYHFVAALIFSSLINVILFFRIIEIGFFQTLPHGEPVSQGVPAAHGIREAPRGMVISSLIAATSLIVLGLSTNVLVSRVIQFVF